MQFICLTNKPKGVLEFVYGSLGLKVFKPVDLLVSSTSAWDGGIAEQVAWAAPVAVRK